MANLSGETALVTGASRGTGRAAACARQHLADVSKSYLFI
jgi:NAD(P)-dependent dehydrogenase (short-subunit alcohol dehydrogenase family)